MPDPAATDGWCPFATQFPTGKFWQGNQGRKAIVLHIAQGGYDAAVRWLSDDQLNPNSSAHFVIAKDGRIAQLVSINDSAWANGLRWDNGQWYTPADPPRVEHPPWVDIVAGVNPNLYTISIEHEGFYTESWTAPMYAANTRLLKWIASQLSSQTSIFTYVPHRTLIGHYEIDPIDRANCPGPNVNYAQIASDSNGTGLVSQVVPQPSQVHIFGTTALVSLPSYNIVSQLTEVDIPAAGYLDFQGRRWYISQYSYQHQISNFFDSAATMNPAQDLTASLSLNPGYRDAVTPSSGEFAALGPAWIRVLLPGQYQNQQTGQNTELDWLLGRIAALGINVEVLLNAETANQNPPPHGSPNWGDSSSGYIGQVSDLARKIVSFYGNRIGAIEIWNEPDVQGIAPEDYGQLLKAAYAKVKAGSTIPVISGGICCGENLDYLRRFTAVARGSYDGLGWHVYGERVDGYPFPAFGSGELRNSLGSARTIGGAPLWVSEIGARLEWNWGTGAVPEDAVAAYLTKAYTLMQTLGRTTVAEAFWFTWKIGGEGWGLVDDTSRRRAAWYTFQQAARPKTTPPGPPIITAVTITPSTVPSGQLLNLSFTVKNNGATTLVTQGPDPGFVYNEGENFQQKGFVETKNAIRVGVDFSRRTGIDHPYRWGLGAPLDPGKSVTVNGAIRLNTTGTRDYWAGLVQELTAWLQDNQGKHSITITTPPVPIGTQPVITNVALSPFTLIQGDKLNVSITVRNDSGSTLPTMGPEPGFVYEEGESFSARGFPEQKGAFRVGIEFEGRMGIDHPYRWGFGAPLAAGQSVVINGAIHVKNTQSKKYWAGLVDELIAWVQDNQGTQQITVKTPPTPPPPTGSVSIQGVTFSPTTLNQGQLVQITATIVNNSNAPLPSQGPQPGFVYNEGDNFLTKGNPPANGAYRIGVDFDGRTGVDHPYRWGFGTLMPGQSVTFSGYVRLNRKQQTRFWAALIREGVAIIQDQVAITLINVEKP